MAPKLWVSISSRIEYERCFPAGCRGDRAYEVHMFYCHITVHMRRLHEGTGKERACNYGSVVGWG